MDMNTKDIKKFIEADKRHSYKPMGEIAENIKKIMEIVEENHFRAKAFQHNYYEEEDKGLVIAEILYSNVWAKLYEVLEEIPKELLEMKEEEKQVEPPRTKPVKAPMPTKGKYTPGKINKGENN